MFLKSFSFLALFTGCVIAKPTTNPSLPISRDEATAVLKSMEKKRVKLERPLIIVGGFLDIGVGPAMYANLIGKYVDGPIVRVTNFDLTDLPRCRERLVQTIDRTFGVVANDRTIEVDVIGQSLGGLIAVYSLLDEPALGKRLNAHRVFTISSPLQGAKLAMWTPFNVWTFQADMRPGSELYQRFAKTEFPCPIYSYTRLEDGTVGEQYAALPGRGVWWVDNPGFERAHVAVFSDRRVLLDIARRLRGEQPIATDPPAPLPAAPATRPTTRPTVGN